jgi:mycothiol synthase
MPEPEDLHLRTATPDDAELVAAILDECTSHYFSRPSSIDDAHARLRMGRPEHDFVVALDPTEEPLGLGHVWPAPPDEVRCYIRVRPSAKHRGAASALLSHLVPRARELVVAAALDPAAILTLTSWAEDTDAAPFLGSRGLAPLRYFLQMRIDLAGSGESDIALPEGVELAGYVPERDDAGLFHAFQEAFADHWGQAGVDEAEWWSENRDAPNAGFDPGLWFVAASGDETAGFSIARERDEDGLSTGWVSLVGVRPAWRGRGIGEALLAHTLNVFRRRGLARAALNVDAENMTGALRLYRKVGMEPKPSFTIWSMPLT